MYHPARPADYDFPCSVPGCTPENRLCELHTKKVLYIKVAKIPNSTGDGGQELQVDSYTIPFGNWESWAWYHHAVAEATGLAVGSFRLIYAGSAKDVINDHHSGL